MTTVKVVSTCDTAIEKDDNLTHLVCRYDVPLQGPVTDPTVRALCGRNTYGDSFGITGPICVVCKQWHEGNQQRVPERARPVAAYHMTTHPFEWLWP